MTWIQSLDGLDIGLILFGLLLLAAFVYIVLSYAKGLKGCPRELYLLYLAKVLEYAAYGGMNMAFVLYLSADCGLGDVSAGTYIGVWSMIVTVGTILVGSVVDAIGIKRTLLLGTFVLLFSRFCMPLVSDIYVVTFIGFIPTAIGIAIMGPVLSVGIKRYTTRDQTTLGFGLFYTLMNVGWAIGGVIFDEVRTTFGEHSMVAMPGLPITMSTYQIIFMVGFMLTLPTLFLILVMRDGVERTDDGRTTINPIRLDEQGGKMLDILIRVTKKAGLDTLKIFKEVVTQKAFWYFLFMLGILVFVRLVFYHFHYTFPKYGIRVLGEGVKIGNIYGVLNPTLIVFLVPLISALTKKISSYRMMIFGTTLSSLSIFLATFPSELWQPLMDTWVAELVFDRWLDVPLALRDPVFIGLIIFIILFTIGEAFWSPRLMQFTAEIAPPGREGSYIALSYLPYFGAKLFVGPMSGLLLEAYVPLGEDGQALASYPNHYLVWVWIGAIAILSPIGLLVFRRLFKRAEQGNIEQAVS
jgi:dipeptide/tripeptide permease